jgi:glyoxylase-like metal-dependent hydrolase (beta-lactamase superfamily II)/8-oxo-dGTP pyrophosphatase MutT (NUDIX family)
MNLPPIRDAATAVLCCDGEILMLRRQPELPSFAGYWAFPGGKIEAADATTETALVCAQAEAAVLAGIAREVREELGMDLDALARAGEVLAVHLIGEATTPPLATARFRTRFLRIDLATRPALALDEREHSEACWDRPAGWLARYRTGRLLLAPPTRDAVTAFANDPACTSLPDFDNDGPTDECRILEPLAGLRIIPVRSHTLPPATHTNAFLIGDHHQVLVDPSPADRTELARLMKLLDRTGVDEILLTHHHPDHRAFANELAAHYDVPLSLSDTTRRFIKAEVPDYFGELLLRTYDAGDVVTRWLGEPVRVVPVPGHDAGQIALMPDSKAWFIVGDLIQGIGTVVIAKPEGHMATYCHTLQQVIDLDPAVIVPSHGMAMGGTHRLKETLKHRLEREAAVLKLHQQGLSPEAMLPVLYHGVDQRL